MHTTAKPSQDIILKTDEEGTSSFLSFKLIVVFHSWLLISIYNFYLTKPNSKQMLSYIMNINIIYIYHIFIIYYSSYSKTPCCSVAIIPKPRSWFFEGHCLMNNPGCEKDGMGDVAQEWLSLEK